MRMSAITRRFSRPDRWERIETTETAQLDDDAIEKWLLAWPSRTPVTFKSHLRCLSALCTRAKKKGWIDVDPTRGTFVGDDYIKIAIGRDYSDVPPNRGVWKGRADETIAVSVKVEPIQRVPTDWSDWSAIQAPWSAASWIQSQSRIQRVKLNPQASYRQQQGQQQQ